MPYTDGSSPAFPKHIITVLDEWLDANVGDGYQLDKYGQSLAQDWARIGKVIEELGEAIQIWIGLTGQNPRKGTYGTPNEFQDEIADTIITGILCLQHFTKDADETAQVLAERWQYRMTKLELR
jgi:hypothetical protein